MRRLLHLWFCCVLALAGQASQARTYLLNADTDLVGQMQATRAEPGLTLMDVARSFDLGYTEIRLANPEVDIWLADLAPQLVLPTLFLLPDTPRRGLVINRSEMRLYYYDRHPTTGQRQVTTFPIGIGRSDRQTPLGQGQIVMKVENPAWFPTAKVRADHAARGEHLPAKVPPGPDNPLGQYAMMLDLPGYVIHGTNRPDGIGMLVSQGCVRLYPEDIERLVWQVPKWASVTIVDQPMKVGIDGGNVWVEVHPPVYQTEGGPDEQVLIRRIVDLLAEKRDVQAGKVDWEKVTEVYQRADGIPTRVSGLTAGRLPLQRAEK